MKTDTLLPLPELLSRIRIAIGEADKVLYECLHVYPCAAPAFTASSESWRAPTDNGPFQIYIHVPVCNYSCDFCSYYKVIRPERAVMEKYVAAIGEEIKLLPARTPVSLLYVGGGTPTALPVELFSSLLESVYEWFSWPAGSLRCVECSPESLTDAHRAALRRWSVKRVSMGVDSLDHAVLAAVRRRHTAEQALRACRQLVDDGFFVNVDLIYGLPGQTAASFELDVDRLADCGTHSFTLYNLRMNEQAVLGRVTPMAKRMSLEELIHWRALAAAAAKSRGYVQTRGHTFTRPDAPVLPYRRAACVDGYGFGHQAGFGPSAVSHLGWTIYENVPNLHDYMQRTLDGVSPVNGIFPVTKEDRRAMFVARSLGEAAPLKRKVYQAEFGTDVAEDFDDVLNRLEDADLVQICPDLVELTTFGNLVYDCVTRAFYPPRIKRWLDERQHDNV